MAGLSKSTHPAGEPQGFLNSKRGRILIENLTAYGFLLPASLIIFVFELFPIAFAFFVSLHRWRRFPEEYVGLSNFHGALGNFAYVVFFWIGIGLIAYGLYRLYKVWTNTRENQKLWLLAIPALINAVALLLFMNWFGLLLPVVMDIANRVRGMAQSTGLFLSEFFASFQFPQVADASTPMVIGVILAIIANIVFMRLFKDRKRQSILFQLTMAIFFLLSSFFTLQLTVNEIQMTIEVARADGTELPIWSQIIILSVGALMVGGSYLLWQRATHADSNRRFFLAVLTAIALLVGGYLIFAELPRALAEADDDIINGLNVGVMFTLGTVPFQLAIGLGLAYLLFQNIRAKSFFRIVYFLPYITPWVATSVVFTQVFAQRSSSPANSFLTFLGMDTQNWLLEPKGIFELMFGPNIPEWLVGPSLALLVIMLFNIWTYAGYSTVIFLAGLGNIPTNLYEAARIDGASGWRVFRHITLPLLSPTTFFLSLIAIIGTFQAFTQIWLMRTSASRRSVDTLNIYIFNEINAARPNYANGAAIAFVLFAIILVLTLIQNRIAGRRVFYG